jgi:hypothetical protein
MVLFRVCGQLPATDTSLSHARNRDAVFRLELLVSRLFLHVHTLQDRVLHFIFEAALPKPRSGGLYLVVQSAH